MLELFKKHDDLYNFLFSRFAMEVDGIFYIAQVRQKEKAWRMYKEARARNQTAGLVDVEARHSNRCGEIAIDD